MIFDPSRDQIISDSPNSPVVICLAFCGAAPSGALQPPNMLRPVRLPIPVPFIRYRALVITRTSFSSGFPLFAGKSFACVVVANAMSVRRATTPTRLLPSAYQSAVALRRRPLPASKSAPAAAFRLFICALRMRQACRRRPAGLGIVQSRREIAWPALQQMESPTMPSRNCRVSLLT